ncbi:MAG: transketolase [Atopobiaceae bacterium]|jgi:transketolase|nr:transketolase [Atopobiaceae bacterium]MCH4120387.1 transketolase [Atopobiaceae bacterium]MCI1319019.1 transketolase [Atopobiaceae bacterium]MCI1389803.1 transketolase [Atopobiaceae bacterium]MCI1431935.1 transketolase [Atopobiaceae bacterium]
MSTTYEVPVQTRSAKELKLIANDLRRDIITMLEKSKSGHPGGSLSSAEIISVLYFSGLMRYDADKPEDPFIDHFVLSKGHAAPVLYAAFHQLGWISDEDILTLRQLGSKLQGHPDCHCCPGLEVCTGSLGQGLSIAAGIALGLKKDAAAAGTEPNRVFVLLGDGEMQEGSNWESIMFAGNQGLDNMIAFLDKNRLQIDGPVDEVNSLGDIQAKFASFGWDVMTVDGHDVSALTEATSAAIEHTGTPTVIVCDTVKGKGVSFMENQVGWHGSAPNAEQAAQALAEIAAKRAEIEKEA